MSYQNQKDETLVMLTLAGEQKAYEALVIRYQNAVIAKAAAVTRSRFMAEDTAQDAFVTAWMKLDTLQEPERFGAWVCKIAKNCALNTVRRFQSYLPLDEIEQFCITDEDMPNPEEQAILSEETDNLHQSIEGLPAKVKQIIRLHYFEGLSIAEIADRMRISAGTVKWQLHDGRKRIRKGLCAMNEKWNDTLVQKVMKKVEELKLWDMKNSKNGFEVLYQDVLREIEELPESESKYHALADVLIRGWWWLPGEKNDALFARISEAAVLGKNDEVMTFIVRREDSQVSGMARVDFIREKQIPRLEKAGFVQATAHEWFSLGYEYFRNGQPEKGKEAYQKVRALLKPCDAYYALVPHALDMEEKRLHTYKDKNENRYLIGAGVNVLKNIDGVFRLCQENRIGTGQGFLYSVDPEMDDIFYGASRCDGQFFDDKLGVGETLIGTDGTTLTFAGDDESVETPCGTFDGCQLWIIRRSDENSASSVYKSYYKNGIGIVRYEHLADGIGDARVLKAYHIAGGNGLLPLAIGNTWEYTGEYAPDIMVSQLIVSVSYADDSTVIIAESDTTERLAYDENSWSDMIQQIRNEYCTHGETGQKICDVYSAIERAKALAKMPMEKAHTAAACAVARRILETDSTFNPDHTATGYWNFFAKSTVQRKDGNISLTRPFRWSFEWKHYDGSKAETPLLYNDIYGILQEAANGIWSEEWQSGAEPTVEYMLWNSIPIKTKIECHACEPITTKAGTFENCLHLSLHIGGYTSGFEYRGGNKEYYLAEGIGIVRTVSEYCNGFKKAVYELTAYQGTGEGYMPLADGMMRHYDAQGLTDGFVGAAEYTYAESDEGQFVIFENRTGIRETLPLITQYSRIQGEVIEESLWNAGKREESRLRHDINNFELLLHFLGRDNRNLAAPKKAAEWGKYRIKIIEFLAEGGEIPRAWLGQYWSAHFRTACALFGNGQREEGYQYLERAFALYPKWAEIPDGEALEVGNDWIYGGIKVIKGKALVELPDGTREPSEHTDFLNPSAGLMYYGMTAPRGWEWFNSVRGEERFKEYIERAKKWMEAKS